MINLVTLVLLALCVLFSFIHRRRTRLKLPPGPWGFPLIGNALAVSGRPFITYAQWQRDHGDIFMVTFGPIRVLVLGTPELIKECFSNPNCNGRPSEWSAVLLTDGRNGLLTTEGAIWEEQRRFTAKTLRSFGFGRKMMESNVLAEVLGFVESLKPECGKSISLNGRFDLVSASILWKIISGKSFRHNDEDKLELLQRLYRKFGQPTITAITMLIAPGLLNVFPGILGLNSTLKVRDDLYAWLKEEVQEHLESLPSDGLPRDYIDAYLMEIAKTTDAESSFFKEAGMRSLIATIAEFFFGATETVTLSLMWAMLYVTAHDEVRWKLQDEIDRIVPPEAECVSLQHRLKMPYTEAVVLETFRHSGIVTTGVMHRVMADMKFHDFDIPANTWIMPNLHAVLHNERFWASPNVFLPERFLDHQGKTFSKHPNLVAFSAGKRSCLGEAMAKDEIFLFLANIYRKFDIIFDSSKPQPELSPKKGFLLYPQDFDVIITERHRRRERLTI